MAACHQSCGCTSKLWLPVTRQGKLVSLGITLPCTLAFRLGQTKERIPPQTDRAVLLGADRTAKAEDNGVGLACRQWGVQRDLEELELGEVFRRYRRWCSSRGDALQRVNVDVDFMAVEIDLVGVLQAVKADVDKPVEGKVWWSYRVYVGCDFNGIMGRGEIPWQTP